MFKLTNKYFFRIIFISVIVVLIVIAYNLRDLENNIIIENEMVRTKYYSLVNNANESEFKKALRIWLNGLI